MLASFVFLQMKVDEVVILGKLSDDFQWLRNSNYLSMFVHPEFKSELLMPTVLNDDRERGEIICFVMTRPINRLRRSAIRRTWGKQIKPIFMMGRSDNETMNFIISEAKVFDDIIVEDFVDSYMNLTLKTAFALKHFTRHFNHSKYFLKIDDDVMLNVENLYQFLQDENLPKNAIIGSRGLSTSPHRERESKWYIPRWLYGNDSFPPYIDGPAYLIPGTFLSSKQHFCYDVYLANILSLSLSLAVQYFLLLFVYHTF